METKCLLSLNLNQREGFHFQKHYHVAQIIIGRTEHEIFKHEWYGLILPLGFSARDFKKFYFWTFVCFAIS